jgi:hypothetical protein
MNGSVRPIVVSVALAGFGVFASVWVVIWLLRGSYPTALIVLGLAIWAFGFALFFLYTTLGATKPRIEADEAGILLRPGKFVDTVFIVPTVAITIVAGLYLIFFPLGMIDYVQAGTPRISAPVGFIVLLLFAVPTLFRVLKHRGSGHLHLGPAGFEVWNAQWGSFRHGSWEDIEQILDQPVRGPKPPNDVIVFVLANKRSVTLMSAAVTDDSDALLEWVLFYWQHPEYRGELVDERGLRRLSENLTVE